MIKHTQGNALVIHVRHTAVSRQAAAEWPQVQEAVARLCLAWWQARAPAREAFVPQTLPYLLVRALTTGAPGRPLHSLHPHTRGRY